MPAVVIGAGPAGLSVSWELTALGVDHVVLERARVAQAWCARWDSFTLVTPNWTLDLPGSERLGHASPMITLTVYGHVMPAMQREAATNVAAMVYNGS
jgi:putative flavoprotein involved in K+ transport